MSIESVLLVQAPLLTTLVLLRSNPTLVWIMVLSSELPFPSASELVYL